MTLPHESDGAACDICGVDAPGHVASCAYVNSTGSEVLMHGERTVESMAREALLGFGLDDEQIAELACRRREYIKTEGLANNEPWAAELELTQGDTVLALKRVQHLINMDIAGKSL